MQPIEIPNYKLNKHFNYYTFSDEDGRDVFYYHLDSEQIGFPYQISINIESFENNHYLKWCFWRLNEAKVYDEHFERYLFYLFRRALKYREFNLFVLDEVILDKNGKYCPAVNKTLLKNYKKVTEDIPSLIYTDKPYSKRCSEIIFHLLKMQITSNHISEKCTPIERVEFENGLINDSMKFAYVEEYDSNSNFFSEIVGKEDEHNEFYKEVFIMATNKNVKLIYLK